MKNKLLIILILLVSITFFSGITYSMFHSNDNLSVQDQEIAEFIFNASRTSHIELNFESLNPGDSEEFKFQVSNTKDNNVTNVTTEYQISIKTFHFMPLLIELYKGNDLVMTCEETKYSRNEDNALVCNSSIWELDHKTGVTEDFKINVSFPNEFNSIEYTELVDYIEIDISSWQKIKKK